MTMRDEQDKLFGFQPDTLAATDLATAERKVLPYVGKPIQMYGSLELLVKETRRVTVERDAMLNALESLKAGERYGFVRDDEEGYLVLSMDDGGVVPADDEVGGTVIWPVDIQRAFKTILSFDYRSSQERAADDAVMSPPDETELE